MSNTLLIFFGILLTFGWSWVTMVSMPYKDMGKVKSEVYKPTGELYPNKRAGIAGQGREVYKEHGCVQCHTMQNRAPEIAYDSRRGWGTRHTTIQDFAFDPQPQLGMVRFGPDLAAVGARKADREWHLLHLYNPRTVVQNSVMPPYPFLFEKRKIRGNGSQKALKLSGEFAPEAGYEIVPTDEAEALVSYLLSLRHTNPIFSAPPPPTEATNAPAAITNAAPVQTPPAQ